MSKDQREYINKAGCFCFDCFLFDNYDDYNDYLTQNTVQKIL